MLTNERVSGVLAKLRGDKAAIIWTLVRIYVGWEWLVSGWEKIGNFDATGFLKSAIDNAAGENPAVLSWYASFLEYFALPNIGLINFLVAWGGFFVGIGLIIGCFTTTALYAGAFMNLNFMLAGVTSINPILYTLTIILLVMRGASYRWGIDYYLLPKEREMFNKDQP